MSFFIRPAAANITRRSATGIVGLGAIAKVTAGGTTYGTKSSTAVSPPAAILESAEINTQGIGLLRRAKVQLKAFSAAQFSTMYDNVVKPGSEFTVTIGRPGGTSRSVTFRTYNFDFKLTKLGGYDVQVEGVASGAGNGSGGSPWTDYNVLRGDLLPNRTLVNTTTGDVSLSTGDIVSYMFHSVSTEMDARTGASYGNLFVHDWGIFFVKDGIDFDIINVMCNMPAAPNNPELTTNGGIVSTGADDSGNARIARAMQYYSLETIVKVVNTYVLGGTGYEIFIGKDSGFSLGSVPASELIPPDPYNLIYNFGHDFEYRNADITNSAAGTGGAWWFNYAFTMPTGAIGGSEYRPKLFYVSELQLSNILGSVRQQSMDSTSQQEGEEKNLGEMKLSDFFAKIFAVIKKDTGGLVDLTLDVKEGDEKSILVVNKQKDPGTITNAITLSAPDGTYGIRDIKLNGKVPKSLQAKMFGTAPDTTSTSKVLVDNGVDIEYEAPSKPSTKAVDLATQIGENLCQGSGTDAARVHNNTWGAYAKDQLPQVEPSPLPLDLGFTVDGGTEIKFGNPVEIGGLPGFLTGNDTVFWTVTEVTDRVQGNDWTTDVKTVARMKPIV